MADTWLTIEQAAVALGLSVRTVNRHIVAGKIQSRLNDGRREVLVDMPEETTAGVSDDPADEIGAAINAAAGGSAASPFAGQPFSRPESRPGRPHSNPRDSSAPWFAGNSAGYLTRGLRSGTLITW